MDKPEYSAIFAEYRKEFIVRQLKEYGELLNLDNIKDAPLQDRLKQVNLSRWSLRNRLRTNIRQLKFDFAAEKTGVLTTCFKVTLDGISCIYAYLHSECRLETTPVGAPERRYASKLTHRFFVTGPTYRSQDGEYRNRLLPYSQMQAVMEKYAKEFAIVEEQVVIPRLSAGNLSFQVDFYHPRGCRYNTLEFEDFINDTRLAIKLCMWSWMYDFSRIHNKTIDNHTNPAYRYIFCRPEDKPVYDKIYTEMGEDKFKLMEDHLFKYFTDISQPHPMVLQRLVVGQKLFPITVMESTCVDDPRYSVWREIYLSGLVSNLVASLISPSFPIIGGWFYVQKAHGGLFDNLAMHDKYLHSGIGSDISARLRTADALNYVTDSAGKHPINNKFAKVSRSIRKSIIQADSHIRLTDLAICVTSEYVGRTMRDIPTLIAAKSPAYKYTPIFGDYDLFVGRLFEYIYAFYVMNYNLGLMHGDPHINNITLHQMYNMDTLREEGRIKNPHIVYVIGNSAYAFKYCGIVSSLIDFSRTIIGDSKLTLEYDYDWVVAEMYLHDQRSRLLGMINNYMPEVLTKYKDRIESMMIGDLPLLFKIITALDTFVVATNIDLLFKTDDVFVKGNLKILPGIQELLQKIASTAEQSIIQNLEAVIKGEVLKAKDIEWPNLSIIKMYFGDYLFDTAKQNDPDITVVDIYNSNNDDIIYDMGDYDKWPPLMKFDTEIELRKKYGLPPPSSLADWEHHLSLDETAAIKALSAKYENAERIDQTDLMQVESWMLA